MMKNYMFETCRGSGKVIQMNQLDATMIY